MHALFKALPVLALAISGCAGGGGGGGSSSSATADPGPGEVTSNTITVGPGGTSSAAPILATPDGATVTTKQGATYPIYQNVARASNSSPQGVNASLTNDPAHAQVTLNTSVDGSTASVIFGAKDVLLNSGDVESVQKTQNGITYSLLLAGAMSLDYSRFGVWEQDNGDTLLQSNELLAAIYGGLETPVSNIPTTGSFTYHGQTLGVGIDRAGNVAAITGNIGLTANFADRSMTGNVSSIALSGSSGVSFPGTTATLTGNLSGNGYAGSMLVKDSTAATVGDGSFDGRFFGPAAQETAGKWIFQGTDGIKAMGAFGARH